MHTYVMVDQNAPSNSLQPTPPQGNPEFNTSNSFPNLPKPKKFSPTIRTFFKKNIRYITLILFLLIAGAVIGISQLIKNTNTDDRSQASQYFPDGVYTPIDDNYLVGAIFQPGWTQEAIQPPAPGLINPEIQEAQFCDRIPLTGWHEDQLPAMKKQVEWAAENGIDYFLFNDFYTGNLNNQQKSNYSYLVGKSGFSPALERFLEIEKNNFGFAVMYMNRLDLYKIENAPSSSQIDPWEKRIDQWIGLFKKSNYLKIWKRPVFFILSPEQFDVVFEIGQPQDCGKKYCTSQAAITKLQEKAKAAGFKGGVLVVGMNEKANTTNKRKSQGYQAITTYGPESMEIQCPDINENNAGKISNFNTQVTDKAETFWKKTVAEGELPYIPTIVAGWDNRPWRKEGDQSAECSPVNDTVYTPFAFKQFLQKAKNFVDGNQVKTTFIAKQKILNNNMVILTAWNELGIGHYLIPTIDTLIDSEGIDCQNDTIRASLHKNNQTLSYMNTTSSAPFAYLRQIKAVFAPELSQKELPIEPPRPTSITNSYSMVNQVLCTGQSLSLGAHGPESADLPSSGTSFDFTKSSGHLSLNPGPTVDYSAHGYSLTADFYSNEFIPLKESRLESMSTSFANSVSRFANKSADEHKILVSCHGIGGADYSKIKYNGSSRGFNNGLAQVEKVKQITSSQNINHQVTAITLIHGEADHTSNNQNYSQDIKDLQLDYTREVNKLLNTSGYIPLLYSQMSSWTTSRAGYNPTGSSLITYQQYEASKKQPNQMVLVGPKYFLQYTDGIHLTNESYNIIGEYYAKAYVERVVNGGSWRPVWPWQTVVEGNKLTVHFNVPKPPLALDDQTVSNPGDYGFKLIDNVNTEYKLENIALNPLNVILTFDKSIDMSQNPRITYAMFGNPGQPAGPTTGPRGNLRDSDTTMSSFNKKPLYNWAVHFCEPLTEDGNCFPFSDKTKP